LYLVFLDAILDGVQLFDETIPLDITYDQARHKATEYARKYTTEWLTGLDKVSAEGVRSAIEAFIETPGMTIGGVAEMLADEDGDGVPNYRDPDYKRQGRHQAQSGQSQLAPAMKDVKSEELAENDPNARRDGKQ